MNRSHRPNKTSGWQRDTVSKAHLKTDENMTRSKMEYVAVFDLEEMYEL